MRGLLYIPILALVSGCVGQARPFTVADRAALDRETHLDDVESGHASPKDAVVRVVSHGVFCSGAVIGDSLVVTAGHCVGDAYVDGIFTQPPGYVRVELGSDALPWGRVGARDVMVCDGWDGSYEHDIGFVVLDRPLPLDVPRFHPRVDEGDVGLSGASFVSRGFGTAMVRSSVPDFGDTWSTHGVERKGTLSWSSSDAFAMEMPSASGDSGGPVLAEGTNDLIGVTSERRESSADAPPLTIAARLSSCRATLRRARAVASMI